MTHRTRALVAAVALLPVLALAEPPDADGLPGVRPGPPEFLRYLFRPEVVMRNQEAIGLTAAQRAAITTAMDAAQDRLLDLRWQLAQKGETATPLFSGPRVDPETALAAARELMALEEQVKETHLRLLIAVKNVLTPEQQHTLREREPEPRGGRR